MRTIVGAAIVLLALATGEAIAQVQIPCAESVCIAGIKGKPTNAILNPGDTLFSPNKGYKLVLQGDGNLVLYEVSTGNSPWSMRTNGKTVSYAAAQMDGHLVLYGPSGPVENGYTDSWGDYGEYFLSLQDDGNLVMYRGQPGVPGAVPVWSSRTGLIPCNIVRNGQRHPKCVPPAAEPRPPLSVSLSACADNCDDLPVGMIPPLLPGLPSLSEPTLLHEARKLACRKTAAEDIGAERCWLLVGRRPFSAMSRVAVEARRNRLMDSEEQCNTYYGNAIGLTIATSTLGAIGGIAVAASVDCACRCAWRR